MKRNPLEAARLVLLSCIAFARQGVRRRGLIADGFALISLNCVTVALGILQGVVVARLLGPERYGSMAVITAYPLAVYAFFDAQSRDVSIKYFNEFQAIDRKAEALALGYFCYFVDLALAFIAVATVAATAGWAAATLARNCGETGLIILFATVLIPRSLAATSHAILISAGEVGALSRVGSITTGLQSVIVVVWTAIEPGSRAVIQGMVVAQWISGIILPGYALSRAHKRWGGVRGWAGLKPRLKEICKFLMLSDATALTALVPKNLDVLILAGTCSSVEVGYYKIASTIKLLLGNVITPFQSLALRELAAAAGSRDFPKFNVTLRRLSHKVALALAGCGAIGVVVGPKAVVLAFGSAYEPARVIIQVLLIGMVLWAVMFWVRPAILATAGAGKWLVVMTSISALTVILWLLLVPRLGAIGTALGWSVAVAVGHFGAVLWFRSYRTALLDPVAEETSKTVPEGNNVHVGSLP